ncbi:MAG: hypothetical protein IT176_09855 [Acidobacteria bacterium]|nr:hypothetical protein [Acidobacteriota bacterium]
MPNKIVSKHNFRYVPRMMGLDIVKKLRAQLDANGYKDVEMKLIGDVPWSRGSSRDTDITHAGEKATAHIQALGLAGGSGDPGRPRYTPPAPARPTAASLNSNGMGSDLEQEATGGYWPSYLWADGEVGQKVGTIRIPMGMGGSGGGGGGRNHAANEYYIVESQSKAGGMATAEKAVAATLFEYSRITTVPPRPKK